MDANGGYLQANGQAPLWIGEFGTDLGTRANMSGGWMGNFLAYAQARRLHWCWWQLNAQSVKGTEPCTNAAKAADGDREGYGLMQGQDWLGDQSEMLAVLAPLMTRTAKAPRGRTSMGAGALGSLRRKNRGCVSAARSPVPGQ